MNEYQSSYCHKHGIEKDWRGYQEGHVCPECEADKLTAKARIVQKVVGRTGKMMTELLDMAERQS